MNECLNALLPEPSQVTITYRAYRKFKPLGSSIPELKSIIRNVIANNIEYEQGNISPNSFNSIT
jgi:hypothetical protein